MGAEGTMARVLLLLSLCLHSVFMEQSRILEQRKPFFERFRRLEEQFRRFQEVTLTRLQGIAENYNISYNIDARFHHILDQQQSLARLVNSSNEGTQRELNDIRVWLKKMQKKTKKLDLKVSALEEAMADRNKQMTKENKARDVAMTNLTSSLSSQKRIIYQLAKDKSELLKGMEVFRESVERQSGRIADLEKRLRSMEQNEILPLGSLRAAQKINQTPENRQMVSPETDPGPITVQQRMVKLQAKHSQGKKLLEEQQMLIPTKNKMVNMAAQQEEEETRTVMPSEEKSLHLQATTMPPIITEVPRPSHTTGLQEDQEKPVLVTGYTAQVSALRGNVNRDTGPPGLQMPYLQSTKKPPQTTTFPQQQEEPTKPAATICNVDSMLIFPNASTENYATFSKGLREGLHELSICSWVRTSTNYLGTILSYATEENDNKLVLHGKNGAVHSFLHFVIGDPAFRELPTLPLVDGNWHHTCFIWSSIQGKYWFYVDRRLTSTGSRFQRGYEIPSGGSLVLGQEQDTLGGGFDASEAFVGHLAGFAMWNRALSPGEVSGIATGRGLPRGTILTLADASSLHGSVQRVDCACLEHCM